VEKLTQAQAEKIISDTCQMGFSIGGINNPAWVVDHDLIEEYIISITDNTCPVCGSGCCLNEKHDID